MQDNGRRKSWVFEYKKTEKKLSNAHSLLMHVKEEEKLISE